MSETITPALLKAWPLPAPPRHSDKEARGRVLTIAGGAQVPGAAILCGLGALRAGAGKLQMAATAPWATSPASRSASRPITRTLCPSASRRAASLLPILPVAPVIA